jgi:PD-(D/E)XK endonuclease
VTDGYSEAVAIRHHTKDKGDIAAARVQADLIERGAMVLVPFTEHAPFDLVAYLDGVFHRVQVKYRTASKGVLPVHFRSVWSDRNGIHSTAMDREEVDVVAIYSPDTGRCYYLNPADFRSSVSLRLTPPRNGQRTNVLLAEDFLAMPPTRHRPSPAD